MDTEIKPVPNILDHANSMENLLVSCVLHQHKNALQRKNYIDNVTGIGANGSIIRLRHVKITKANPE